MRIFLTNYQYIMLSKQGKLRRERCEPISLLPSETIPNQSLSVKEIIERFTQGQPVDGGRKTYYDNIDDFEAIRPTELSNYDLADATADLKAIEDRQIEAKKAKQEEDEKAKRIKEEELQSKEAQSVTQVIQDPEATAKKD